ncbi:hypothetical protein J437_LFUL016073 [Ladona fulva]|uniref:DDE Tnp4 domain-containing protein n=1 Tax=Ladona fulva TaxID=123851 RepID=A0A8K0KQ48_LADFU|nr:hypothetical protein J437_LFUL016073 [Ladona fulva]
MDLLEIWIVPNAVAALDGKHVRITAPDDTGISFYNYKYFLLWMVDANYKFIMVHVGSYGREGDAGIREIRNGTFGQKGFLPHSNILFPYIIFDDEALRLDEHVERGEYLRMHLALRVLRVFSR